MSEQYRKQQLELYELLTKNVSSLQKEYQKSKSINEKFRIYSMINSIEKERDRIRRQISEIQGDIWAQAWQKRKNDERFKNAVEIPLTFHFVGGNAIPLDDVIFGRIELGGGKHLHESERYLNNNVRIQQNGGRIRETVGAIQDSYVKLQIIKPDEKNIEMIAEFFAQNLPLVKKDKLSLEIDSKNIQFKKDEIKQALKDYLENH